MDGKLAAIKKQTGDLKAQQRLAALKAAKAGTGQGTAGGEGNKTL